MDITIARIVILVNQYGADRVSLLTDLPSSYPPEVSTDPLELSFNVQKGHGVEYIRQHFPGYPLTLLDMVATHPAQEIPNPPR